MEKKQRNKYLIKNTVIFSIGNFSTKLISFFLVPLYTYVLTTEEYGTVDLIFTIGAVISPFLMFNIHEAIKRYSLDKNANHKAILTIAFIMIFFGHLIGLLMVPIIGRIRMFDGYAVEIYFYILAMTSNYVFIEYLRGIEKMKSYTVCNIVASLTIAVLNIVFLRFFRWGIQGYFLSYIVAYYGSGVLAIILGKQYLIFRNWILDKKLFEEMIRFSLPLIPNSLLWWITNSSDRIMVTFFEGAAANGVYAISCKIPTILSTICNIFFQAWQFTAVKVSEDDDNSNYTNQVFDAYLRFVILMSSGLLIMLKPITKIYVSPDFYASWRYTPFLILGFGFSSMATFVGTSYYVVKDMRGNMFSALSGAIINIVLNIVLIPQIGIQGAAIATCVSYIVVFVYRWIDTCKYLKIELKNMQYLLLMICLVTMTGLCFLEDIKVYLLLFLILSVEVFLNVDFLKDLIQIILRKRGNDV